MPEATGTDFVVNPFEYKVNLTVCQKLQLVLMSVTVFPIRVVGLLLSVILLCLVSAIGTFGLPLVPKVPLEGWRRNLMPIVRALLRLGFFCCGYHRIEVRGRENLNTDHDPDVVVAAPHSTFFDPIVIFALKELPTGISRIENLELPFLGYVTKFFTPISVMRTDAQSRRETIEELKTRVLSRMKYHTSKVSPVQSDREDDEQGSASPGLIGLNWPSISCFPEGTTGNGKSLISFKLGAFIPGQPVQPICVRHINSMGTTPWTWIGDGVWKILWMTMCQTWTKAQLTILPLYVPDVEEKKDAVLFASNVQQFMARAMGIPSTDFTFSDGAFVVYLSKIAMRPTRQLLKVNRILMKLKDSKYDLSGLIDNLANSNLEVYESFLGFGDFTASLDNHEVLKELSENRVDFAEIYETLADPQLGKLDVRQFLSLFSISCQPRRMWAIMEVAFKAHCSGGRNFLEKIQLVGMLKTLSQFGDAELDAAVKCILDCYPKPTIDQLLELAQRWCSGGCSNITCAGILCRYYLSGRSLKDCLLGQTKASTRVNANGHRSPDDSTEKFEDPACSSSGVCAADRRKNL